MTWVDLMRVREWSVSWSLIIVTAEKIFQHKIFVNNHYHGHITCQKSVAGLYSSHSGDEALAFKASSILFSRFQTVKGDTPAT